MHPGLLFLTSAAVVVGAGTALAHFADVIAERTRVGGLWVGAVLLAGATSLPELGTDVAAVRLGAADLAVGDLFGSSLANMLILAVVDLVAPRREVLRRVTLDHALAACLALSLNALAAALVLAPVGVLVAGVGPETVLLAGIYVVGTRAVYRHATRDLAEARATPASHDAAAPPSLRRAVLGFAVCAAVILLASPAVARGAHGLAALSGLGDTFVGTWLVGLSTSLPELVASLAAVRLGAYDLAVGNLFGSNAFNMALLVALDLAHPGGPLLAEVSRAHALSGLFAVVLMSLGLAAIVYRAKRRLRMLEPSSALLLLGYALALLALYRARGP